MMRFFNTTGPVVAADHYCVPPLARLDPDELLRLVRDKRYFVLHAPRQTGKTSALLALRDLLRTEGYHSPERRAPPKAARADITGVMLGACRTPIRGLRPTAPPASGPSAAGWR